METASKVFRVRDDAKPRPGHDASTQFRSIDRYIQRAFDAEALFIQNYPAIRASLERHRDLGLLVMAFDAGPEPLAEGWIAATADRTRAVIVGRHNQCRIPLPRSDESMSLRHLAIMVRATSFARVRFRILDLDTGLKFTSESGQALDAITCEGPMFFSVGSIRFVVLGTHPGREIPSDAKVAWSQIPPRVVSNERPTNPLGVTTIALGRAPVADTSQLIAPSERLEGRLLLRAPNALVELDVGTSALRHGILIGRDARCALLASDDRLSRVHALLIRDGHDLLAIDCASTNGTWLSGHEVAIARLQGGEELEMGGVRVAWDVAC